MECYPVFETLIYPSGIRDMVGDGTMTREFPDRELVA
jgi:hypothetical protein